MATRAVSMGRPLAPASPAAQSPAQAPDWRRVAYLFQASRSLDEIEESRLVPERKVLYQFSARGHELGQILLGLKLTQPHDGVGVYYRSRPLMLALGLDLEDAAHLHVLIQALLGLPTPRYRHHRLILGADGKRLAKRDRAETLRALRAAGRTAADVRAMLDR